MKRTDDFLADLETQLGAAAAGRLRRRRRNPVRLLRPVPVSAVAAAAVAAFVLAAVTGGGDPERAAEPPPPAATSGGPFALQMAHRDDCVAERGNASVPGLSVLKRPGGVARAHASVHVVARTDVQPCGFDGSKGPGACTVVELDGLRNACWTARDIEEGRAAAGLGDGFVVALLPDRVREVTLVIGDERDAYAVTDNVVIGNLEGAKEGAMIELVAGTNAPQGCGEGTVEDGPLPEELLVAVQAFQQPALPAPDAVADLLAKSGANRMWLGEARRSPTADADVETWLVPVADSRFAECAPSMVFAPRAFEGPGACLVATRGSEPRGAFCSDLDDIGGISAPDVGGRKIALAFLPHGVTRVAGVGEAEPGGGVLAELMEPGAPLPHPDWAGPDGPVVPAQVAGNSVAVLSPDPGLAESLRDRIARAGIDTAATGAHPPVSRSRVMYTTGMAASARQIAELLRVQDVLPLDAATAKRAVPEADVVVVAGDDLRR